MNININGNLDVESTKQYLEKQLEKAKVIEEFCKVNKIKELNYKDSTLEYKYTTSAKKQVGGAKDE